MAKMNYMVVEGKGKNGGLIRKEGPLDLRALGAWSDEVADQCEPDSVRVLFALEPVAVKRRMTTVIDVPDEITARGGEAKPKRKRRSRAEMAALRAGGTPVPPAAVPPSAPIHQPGAPIPDGYFVDAATGVLTRKPVPGTPENLQALAKEFGIDPNDIELDRGKRVNFTKQGRPRLKRGKRGKRREASSSGATPTTYETHAPVG